MTKCAWKLLGDYLRDTQLLGSIQSTLYWDQNTVMPSQGASWRCEQLSLLAKHLHERKTSNQFQTLLQAAKEEFLMHVNSNECDNNFLRDRSRNIELLEQDFYRQNKFLDCDGMRNFSWYSFQFCFSSCFY